MGIVLHFKMHQKETGRSRRCISFCETMKIRSFAFAMPRQTKKSVDAKTIVIETAETNLTLTGSGAICNWMGAGIFVLNLYVSIDYIDLNKSRIAGNYKYNGGGATGYVMMDFNLSEVAKN